MQTKPNFTKEQKKQHILNNILLLSVFDYTYFFGNPKDDLKNIAISKTKFTIDELKERAGKQIDKDLMDFECMYDDLTLNNEFEISVLEINK